MQIVIRKYTHSFEVFIGEKKYYEDKIGRLDEILRLFHALDAECVFAYQDPPSFDVSDL